MLTAINTVNPREAADPHVVIGEMVKYASECGVDFLLELVNALFHEGLFPDNFTESIIFPLFKNGTVNDPNN